MHVQLIHSNSRQEYCTCQADLVLSQDEPLTWGKLVCAWLVVTFPPTPPARACQVPKNRQTRGAS